MLFESFGQYHLRIQSTNPNATNAFSFILFQNLNFISICIFKSYLCLSYELFSGYDSVLGTNGTLDIEKNQYSICSRCGTVGLFHFLNSKRILCPPIPTHTIIARMQISSILVMMVLSLFFAIHFNRSFRLNYHPL